MSPLNFVSMRRTAVARAHRSWHAGVKSPCQHDAQKPHPHLDGSRPGSTSTGPAVRYPERPADADRACGHQV